MIPDFESLDLVFIDTFSMVIITGCFIAAVMLSYGTQQEKYNNRRKND